MLELKHISYHVSTPEGEMDILKDISITIPDHRLMVFTGPNGGGKTTLAKVIMGLVQPTDGQILFNGEDITGLSITERARRGISYGFQQPPRFKGITVHDLLLLAAGEEKLSKDRCCAYLTKVGLCANDYLEREVDASLSGGEVKRIEIATLLARNAEGEEVLIPGTTVICAVGQRSNRDDVLLLRGCAPWVREIGDCVRVSNITNAMYTAYHAGLDI